MSPDSKFHVFHIFLEDFINFSFKIKHKCSETLCFCIQIYFNKSRSNVLDIIYQYKIMFGVSTMF